MGVNLHKRTTPKIFKRAKELRRDMTPQERKPHAHLRAHRMGDVHFRPQHAIGGPRAVNGGLPDEPVKTRQ